MKCTACGNTELVQIKFPLLGYGEGGATLSQDVKVYVCRECGHLEFFAPIIANEYTSLMALIEKKKQEINDLYLELDRVQLPDPRQEIKDEIKLVEEQMRSLDITIREQQELKARYQALRAELCKPIDPTPEMIASMQETKTINEKIRKLTEELNRLTHELMRKEYYIK